MCFHIDPSPEVAASRTALGMPENKFRLGEFADIAGIAKKTIHYYINIGVLPAPKKVHGRLSLYDSNHVKLVSLVQRLQADKKLPLSFIAQLFKQGGYNAEALELGLIANSYEKMLDGASLLPETSGFGEPPDNNVKVLLDTPSVTADTRQKLVSLGVSSAMNATLALDECKIGLLIEKANELNIPFDAFEKIQVLVDKMVSIESDAIIQTIDGDSGYADVLKKLATIDDLFNSYIRKSKSTLLRKHYEKIYTDAPFSISKLHEKLYIPSHEFLNKHHIKESLLSSDKGTNESLKTASGILKLAEGYMATGNYTRALILAKRAIKKSKSNVDALVLAAGAQAILGHTDEAIVLSEKAVASFPDNAKAAAYHGMICIVQASRVGGIISPGKWLNKGLASFGLSESLTPKNDRDLVDILLMKGRALSIMPPNLGMVDEGIAALIRLEGILVKYSDADFGWAFSGFNAILFNNINFYLGEAFSLKGDAIKVKAYWESLILSDPTSNFGKIAYQRMD